MLTVHIERTLRKSVAVGLGELQCPAVVHRSPQAAVCWHSSRTVHVAE